jgi:hypothetical protein
MDPDNKNKINDLEKKIYKQPSNILPNGSNVFQSSWIRHTIQTSNGLDRFLLDYGFTFLPSCGVISWIIFLIAL